MKFFFIFLSVIIVSSLNIGCESKKAIESEDSTASVTTKAEIIPESGSMEGDTINLHGKFVLFFGPASTGETIDSSNAETKTFLKTSTEILDSLKNIPGVYAGYTSANNIRVYNLANGSPMIIQRNTFKEPAGMIVSDGMQSPMIKKGIVSGQEYRDLINKYFVRPS